MLPGRSAAIGCELNAKSARIWLRLFPLVGSISVVCYLWLTFARRVDSQLDYAQERARQYWSALVEVGVSQDSATKLVLRDTRDRLVGRGAKAQRAPFLVRLDAELVWQSRMLNPLLPIGADQPRTAAEALFVSVRRASFDRVLREGRSILKRRVFWSSALWSAACLLIGLSSAAPLMRHCRRTR